MEVIRPFVGHYQRKWHTTVFKTVKKSGNEHKNKMASVAYQMFIKNKNKEDIRLFPGNPKRDFVYVDDVVDANIFAFENYNGDRKSVV